MNGARKTTRDSVNVGLVAVSIWAGALSAHAVCSQGEAEQLSTGVYERALERTLPLGEWTGDLASAGVQWRVAFRAQGSGPEWLLVIVSKSSETDAVLTAATATIRGQLDELQGSAKQRRLEPTVATRRWVLSGSRCAELRDATQFLQVEGVNLVQPEFALDAPVYDIKTDSVHRRIVGHTQGLGHDARLVKRMTAVRDAVLAGRCGVR